MRRIPITDLHTPELEIYNERREIQLLRYYEPAPGLFHCGECKRDPAGADGGIRTVVASDGTERSGFREGKRSPGADHGEIGGNSCLCVI